MKKLSPILPIISFQSFSDENVIVVPLYLLSFSMNLLKNHIGYQYSLLSCISGVDFLNKKYRFSVVYDLLSISYNSRIRVKIFSNETNSVPTLTKIFVNSNWWEREIWDLYGIYFENHPDLRRILTDYGFEGHPMRKDFPMSGFVEVRYNEIKKCIVVEPIELSQDFRLFNFDTTWK